MAQLDGRGTSIVRDPAAVVAPAICLAICLAFAYNNLSPYLGLNSAGAMTMFSGLSPSYDTHLVLPHYQLSRDFEYVRVVQMAVRPPELKAARELSTFLSALPAKERVNQNFLRYQVHRVCSAAPTVELRLTVMRMTGDLIDVTNACVESDWRSYAVLTGYDACLVRCNHLLERWARGELLRD